jgi:hypothetical protein
MFFEQTLYIPQTIPRCSHHRRCRRISNRYVAAMRQAERPLGTMVLYSVQKRQITAFYSRSKYGKVGDCVAPKVAGSFVSKYYSDMQQEMKEAREGHRRFEWMLCVRNMRMC